MKKALVFACILVLLSAFTLGAASKWIKFTFNPAKLKKAPSGIKTVHVSGEFNGWLIPGKKLTKGDKVLYKTSFLMQKKGGVWVRWIKLTVGKTYAYKFVINKTAWVADPAASKLMEDGFGGKNSVVIVK